MEPWAAAGPNLLLMLSHHWKTSSTSQHGSPAPMLDLCSDAHPTLTPVLDPGGPQPSLEVTEHMTAQGPSALGKPFISMACSEAGFLVDLRGVLMDPNKAELWMINW